MYYFPLFPSQQNPLSKLYCAQIEDLSARTSTPCANLIAEWKIVFLATFSTVIKRLDCRFFSIVYCHPLHLYSSLSPTPPKRRQLFSRERRRGLLRFTNRDPFLFRSFVSLPSLRFRCCFPLSARESNYLSFFFSSLPFSLFVSALSVRTQNHTHTHTKESVIKAASSVAVQIKG